MNPPAGFGAAAGVVELLPPNNPPEGAACAVCAVGAPGVAGLSAGLPKAPNPEFPAPKEKPPVFGGGAAGVVEP